VHHAPQERACRDDYGFGCELLARLCLQPDDASLFYYQIIGHALSNSQVWGFFQ